MLFRSGYPLLRKLTVLVSANEEGKYPNTVDELLRFVLSAQGQEALVKDGLVPLDRSAIYNQQEKLGWESLK